MKCFFCDQDIPYKEIFRSKGFGSLQVGDCPICKNDLIHSCTVIDDNELISAHLYVQWGEERYRFLLHLKENYFALIHVTSNKNARDEIYKTHEIPDINFNNVLSKLPLLLTFL